MSRVFSGAFLAALWFCAGSGSVFAVLNVSLTLDDPIQTVGPNAMVDLTAVLSNDASSDQTLLGANFTSAGIINGTLIDLAPGSGNPYSVAFGGVGGSIEGLLSPVDLAPGESFSFLFATLLPDPAPVAPGVYTSEHVNVQYQTLEFPSGPIEITVVPEPQAVLLLLGALISAAYCRRVGS